MNKTEKNSFVEVAHKEYNIPMDFSVICPTNTEVGKSLQTKENDRLDKILASIMSSGKLKYGNRYEVHELQTMFKDLVDGSSISDVINPQNMANCGKRLWWRVYKAKEGEGKIVFGEKKSFGLLVASKGNKTYLFVTKVASENMYEEKSYESFDLEKIIKAACRRAELEGFDEEQIKNILDNVKVNGWALTK